MDLKDRLETYQKDIDHFKKKEVRGSMFYFDNLSRLAHSISWTKTISGLENSDDQRKT